jgi:uncharacterized membrane protein affecting hemolysin expression
MDACGSIDAAQYDSTIGQCVVHRAVARSHVRLKAITKQNIHYCSMKLQQVLLMSVIIGVLLLLLAVVPSGSQSSGFEMALQLVGRRTYQRV